MQMSVKLISHTAKPLETLKVLWDASRTDQKVVNLDVENVNREEAVELFKQLITAKIPLLENISFVFMLDGVSISLREQMVRHRIGVHFGENFGVDIIPELSSSTWWSQTTRVLNMSNFADDGRYLTIPSLDLDDDSNSPQKFATYTRAMEDIQAAYRKLLELGVPIEDARQVLPMALISRISWTLNGAALRHVLGTRSCWIAQLGIWGPAIYLMVKEIMKVDPMLKLLVEPPCSCGGKFEGCAFEIENIRRIEGLDPFPPCPMYMACHRRHALDHEAKSSGCAWKPSTGGKWTYHGSSDKIVEMLDHMIPAYAEIWPDTFNPKNYVK